MLCLWAMLVKLSVRNLAVVEEAEVVFGRGLNVITGETGAGKSVLMGALRLLLGERADRSIIRTGATETAVCGMYELEDSEAIDALLREAGLPPCEDGVLLLRRTITASGGGRIHVNDSPATASLLRRLAPFLTGIHGPNDNLSLLDDAFQLHLLTAYAGAEEETARYAQAWQALQDARQRLETAQGDPGEREARLLRLSEDLAEIREVAPTEEDGEVLIARHAAAANAEEILALGNALTDRLTDGEDALSEQLTLVHRTLRDLEKLLPEASEWSTELEGIQAQVQDLSGAMAQSLSRIDADPAALEALERRMAQIQRLRRKFGPTIEDVLRHAQEMAEQEDALRSAEGDIALLEEAVRQAEVGVQQAGEALRAKRQSAAPKLGDAISQALRDLGFPKASFAVALEPCAPQASGLDRAVFLFKPNAGERAQPLAEIASSGEIARVMLAIKAVLARHDAVPTLVFDEIDANIGGEVCRRVGEKLRVLAESRQVICVTHQPLVAVFGQTHLCVVKTEEAGRTHTSIRLLDSDGARLDELTRMLGGGEAARQHATALFHSPFGDTP